MSDLAAVSPMPGTWSSSETISAKGHLLLIDIGDETVERIVMCPGQAQHDAMMRGDATVERLLQRLALCLQAPAGQRRELESGSCSPSISAWIMSRP